MAGERNAIELTLRARNEASTALDQLFQDFQKSHRGASEFAQAIGNLNPLLSRSLFTINDFVTGTRHMDSGLRAATVGVGVAVAAFAAYSTALTSSIDKQLAFQTALRSWDMGQVRGQIAGATSELDRLDATLSKLGQNQGWGQAFRNIVGLITQAPAAISELLGFTQPPEARRGQAVTQFNTLATISGRQQATEINAATISQIIAQLTGQQGFAAQGNQFLSYGAIGEDLTQPYLARRRAVQEQFRTGVGTRSLAARTLSGQIFDRLYGGYLPEETLGFEQISDPTLSLEARGALGAGREGILQRDIQRQIEESTKGFELELGGGAEATGVGPTAGETAKGIQAYIARASEARDIDRDRKEILASFAGFTKDQADSIQKEVIELTRLRDIESAAGDDRLEKLINFRAEIAQANLELQKMQRNDPLAGLTKGFEDLARGTGEIMRDVGRNAGRSITQGLDDTFFSVVTGKFKNLGQNIANSLLRSITGATAELITSPIFRALGLSGGGYRGGLMAIPTAGGAFMLVPEGAAAGVPGGVAGYGAGVVGAAPGGGGILDLVAGGIGSGVQALGGYLGLTAGGAGYEAALLAYTGLTAAETAALSGSSAELISAGVSGGSYAGVGGGAALGTVGAGIGFLASLYGAYQTRSAGYGAATGAVGGLVAGATIGSIYPGVGTALGAVVGLIAGAALGAGAGSLGGKQGRPGHPNLERSLQWADTAARQFAAALNEAESGEQLLGALNYRWAPNREFIIIATASDGSERRPDLGQSFAYADLFDPAILASIVVYVGQTGGATPNQQLTQGVRDKIQQIVQAEGGILSGYRETGPGLTRTTFEPFAARIRSPLSGQAFFFSTETARNMGASDASIAGIIRELTRVNSQQDILPDLTAERFLQL